MLDLDRAYEREGEITSSSSEYCVGLEFVKTALLLLIVVLDIDARSGEET